MEYQVLKNAVNESAPLIYMWEIHTRHGVLVGRYVGKAKNGATRPLRHYQRNVRNLLDGKPYRKGNPEGYRKIHRALAEAALKGYLITLQYLCNVSEGENINEIERQCIGNHNCLGNEQWQLNG
ncbi:hypothetical protein B0T49_20290 [Chromobacterium violaceum]|uniref:hypothetical protein n=1 Tax=Chromobacterium violaceum TaxID=536 RepID=UPI0009DA107F|nr:hypothetical protein [Chromobacterium violaceum]OQS45770.1 hypothetical protein B0T48_17935 [Chromobacterium violaceum]OQS46204.1 hypothetical protein B0T49_20290 [Chromobacterium violaceum]